MDDLLYDIYKFSQKNKRTITLQNKIWLITDLLYVFPLAPILQNHYHYSFKIIFSVYCVLILMTYLSLKPLIKNDVRLTQKQAKDLKSIIWKNSESKSISDDLTILATLIRMIDGRILENVSTLKKSLKYFAAFSSAFVIPLLLKIFDKMQLSDLLLIFIMVVIFSFIMILIIVRDLDTWELILTKKSFKYINAKKELHFLEIYLKNLNEPNSK